MRRLAMQGLQVLLVCIIAVAMLEMVIVFSLNYPRMSLLPATTLQDIYVRNDRAVIQMMPECAKYDHEVTYTLRPGTCRFANREFDTTYHVNSLGTRDNEESLKRPSIVMLGDSFTMGWGVEQHETFAHLLELRTGKKVLNAGISSYGTAREMRLLHRIDLSGAETVVVQYCPNDFRENKALGMDGHLHTSSEAQYLESVHHHERELNYFPGLFTFRLLVFFEADARSVWRKKAKHADDPREEVIYFIHALETAPVAARKLRWLVFEINDNNKNNNEFIEALGSAMESKSTPDWIKKRLKPVDVSNIFSKDMYFRLDHHINAQGHQQLAEFLARNLR